MYSKAFYGFDLRIGDSETKYDIKLIKKVFTKSEAIQVAKNIEIHTNIKMIHDEEFNKIRYESNRTCIEITYEFGGNYE
jgi:hypothetical protein